MRLRWTPTAANDLEQIHHYLKEHHPSGTQPTVLKLYEAAQSLKRFPNRGRIGQLAGTRELVMPHRLPYVIVYEVGEHAVHILRVVHASENWPAQ